MRAAAAVLAALTLLRLMVAAVVPLVPDEAYYWVWSRALASGYVDHPPMVALWIWLGTALSGQTELGVRLLGPIAVALETLMLADAAARLFPGRRAGLTTALLWNAMPLIGAGAVIMTPDAPLLLFWCTALWAMARIITGGAAVWWLAAGAAAGLALASKYTAVLLWAGIGLWLLAAPAARPWLRRPAPWLGGLLGLLLFLPVILWNADHGWISFLKQGGRVADWRPERAVTFVTELIGGQIGLASPGVWWLCAVGVFEAVRRLRRRRDPAVVLLLALSLLPAVVFLQHALGDRVQGNWPAILYPAAVIAAAGLAVPLRQRLLMPSVAVGFGLAMLVMLHAVTGLLPVPPALDPVARQMAGWRGLLQQVETLPRRGDFVVVEDYALASELAWNATGGLAIAAIEPRIEPMTLVRGDLTARRGLLLRAERRGDTVDPAVWRDVEPLGFVDRSGPRGGVERYRLWAVTGTGPAIILPSRDLRSPQK